MQPSPRVPQRELFGGELAELLNPKHPLFMLANRIDWSSFNARIAAHYVQDLGRPGLTTRMMVGLLYLKHAFDESDESLLARWVENPYWQYFCGCDYLQHDLPIDPSSLSRWRQRVGAEGLEQLLQATIATAVQLKAVKPAELQVLNVDTTVQEKAIAFPTDARLYHKMRVALVRRARELHLPLRQTYARVGKRCLAQQGRYAHARQYRRAAIEPTIGHLKSDNRLCRNPLRGVAGDQSNVLLAAAGYNLRKLLRWLAGAASCAQMEKLRCLLSTLLACENTRIFVRHAPPHVTPTTAWAA